MATYRANYITRRGNRRVELMDAIDADMVRATLHARGCWVSSVKPHAGTRYRHSTLTVSRKHLLMALEAIHLLVSSGAKIDGALRVAVEQAPAGKLRYVLAAVAEGTVGGNFAASFEQFPNVFPEAVVEILKANQATGDIEEGLKQVCEYYSDMEGIRANAIRGLFMPILGVITFMAAFVVLFGITLPKFKTVFVEIIPLDQMPKLSKVFFRISDVFVAHRTFIFLCTAAAFYGLNKLLGFRPFKRLMTRLGRRMPIVGPAMKATALARLCLTYHKLSANGFKTVGVLEICARVVGDITISEALLRVRASILENVEVGAAFAKESRVFPPEFLTPISIGQRNLPEIFGKLAAHYRNESKKRIDFAIATIEPMLALLIALFALSAAAALILPITMLIDKLGS